MVVALRLLPHILIEAAHDEKRTIVGAFADDVQSYGPVLQQIKFVKAVQKHGAPLGIELNLTKTTIVVKNEDDKKVVEQNLQMEGMRLRGYMLKKKRRI